MLLPEKGNCTNPLRGGHVGFSAFLKEHLSYRVVYFGCLFSP